MSDSVAGICWPHGGTVGCITVTSNLISGKFAAQHGNDAIANCTLAPAGKYRNGAARSWCRTHQHYWGVSADLAALAASGVQRCASHAALMGYVLEPLLLDLRHYASVTLAGNKHGVSVEALPLSSSAAALRTTVPALALACDRSAPLFGSAAIVQLNVTPPALHALHAAGISGMQTGCVNCARCGHPHLDLGTFASRAHRRHYCGNCGHDATHSTLPIVSNPLLALFNINGMWRHGAYSNVHGHTVL